MPSLGVDDVEYTDWDASPTWLIPKRPKGNLFGAYGRHWKYLVCAVDSACRMCDGFDCVQVRDDPLMALTAWRLSRRLRIPFVYQLSHLKEEENLLYAREGIYGSRATSFLKGSVGRWLRNAMLRKANLVFPISSTMADTLGRSRIRRDRMVTLPEGVDASVAPTAYDQHAQAIRERYGLAGSAVLIYAGTLSRFRELEVMLRAVSIVAREKRQVRLLVVGRGKEDADLEWLRTAAGQLGIADKVFFVGHVSHDQVGAHIRAADVGLSLFPANKVYVNSSPIKILEYLALERPVVATSVPDQVRILAESGAGIAANHSAGEYAEAILGVLALPPRVRERMGAKGRDWVASHRDFRVLTRLVAAAYADRLQMRLVREDQR